MSEEVKNMNETKPETATKETAAPVEQWQIMRMQSTLL